MVPGAPVGPGYPAARPGPCHHHNSILRKLSPTARTRQVCVICSRFSPSVGVFAYNSTAWKLMSRKKNSPRADAMARSAPRSPPQIGRRQEKTAGPGLRGQSGDNTASFPFACINRIRFGGYNLSPPEQASAPSGIQLGPQFSETGRPKDIRKRDYGKVGGYLQNSQLVNLLPGKRGSQRPALRHQRSTVPGGGFLLSGNTRLPNWLPGIASSGFLPFYNSSSNLSVGSGL